MKVRKIILGAVLLLMVLIPSWYWVNDKYFNPHVDAEIKIDHSLTCVGIAGAEVGHKANLINLCDIPHAVSVVNYQSDVVVLSRVFHMAPQEMRPIAFPIGDKMVISGVDTGSRDGAENGREFLTLTSDGGRIVDTWSVENTSTIKYVTYLYIIFNDHKLYATATHTIAPGKIETLFKGPPSKDEFVVLDWAIADPS